MLSFNRRHHKSSERCCARSVQFLVFFSVMIVTYLDGDTTTIITLADAAKVAEEDLYGCDDHEKEQEESIVFDPTKTSIEHYLHPRLLEDPSILQDASQKLKAGDPVVIRNAFVPEFAEAMHRDLLQKQADFELMEEYLPDFAFHHHNIYNVRQFSSVMNQTHDVVFGSDESKQFMQILTGRDCGGITNGAASWYKPGDHSLPHTDAMQDRTVAYVWHLAKEWKPEWGGALYWCPEQMSNAIVPATFNTLILFSVTSESSHFVTTVSKQVPSSHYRFAYNGWYRSGWVPQATDDIEGEYMNTPEKRKHLTKYQLHTLTKLLRNRRNGARFKRLAKLLDTTRFETYPPPRKIHTIDPNTTEVVPCRDDDLMSCKQRADDNQCESNTKYMHLHCKRSCGLCTCDKKASFYVNYCDE